MRSELLPRSRLRPDACSNTDEEDTVVGIEEEREDEWEEKEEEDDDRGRCDPNGEEKEEGFARAMSAGRRTSGHLTTCTVLEPEPTPALKFIIMIAASDFL